jgi:hypothetical protein
MLNDTKPRLSRRYGYLWIGTFSAFWCCESRFGFGEGKSPKEAYDRWDKYRAKTILGKAWSLVSDKACDHPTKAILLICAGLFMAMVSPVFFRG